jgi:hypothetical protein
MQNPSNDWTSILDGLVQSNIDFLVVGGAALVLHGIPRSTMDIDIYIPSDDFMINETIEVLSTELSLNTENSFVGTDLCRADLIIGQWISFSIQGGPDIIDVYVCPQGEFYALLEKAELLELKNSHVQVASLEQIKQMKSKVARPIDLADIALIDEYKELFD